MKKNPKPQPRINTIHVLILIGLAVTILPQVDSPAGKGFLTFAGIVLFGVAFVRLMQRFTRRPRHMTPSEHRYYFERQDRKPEFLAWPGRELPKQDRSAWFGR